LTTNYNQEPKSTDYQQKFKYQQKISTRPKKSTDLSTKIFHKKAVNKKIHGPFKNKHIC